MTTVLASDEEREKPRLDLVSRLGTSLGDARDLVELFRALYAEVAQIADATVFLFSLYDETSQTVRVVRQIDRGEEHDGGSFPLGSGFTSEVIRTAAPKLVRNWSTEGPPIRLLYGTEKGELVKPQSAAIVPIMSHGHVLGVLSLQSYSPEAYAESHIDALAVIASRASDAIKHLRVTEQMALEYERRALEVEAVIANMSDALLIVDSRGAIVRLNRQARELLGLDKASLVLGRPLGEHPVEDVPESAREITTALIPVIDAVRAGNDVAETDVELTADGRRVLGVSATVLRGSQPEPQGGVIVLRDVTTARELERLREDVFAMAWHDMLTPITVIRGHAALLASRVRGRTRDRASLIRAAELITRHADRLAELLTVLFDVRCLQAGTLQLSPWPTELASLVRETCDGLQRTTGHALVVTAEEQLVGDWDERRIRQVLTNLLSNAVKYSPDGSTITVSVTSDGGNATVSVTDEGIGLEPEELALLFRRGYRAEQARNVRGGGLGLYFAHGLVAAHGGRMTAESPGHGRGSTFSFVLPLRSHPVEREAAS